MNVIERLTHPPDVDDAAIQALVDGRHGDPFSIPGPHDTPDGCVVRVFQPAARSVEVIDQAAGEPLARLVQVHSQGLFAGLIFASTPYRLCTETGVSRWETEDPYAFAPSLGDLNLHLLAESRHQDLARWLGSHPIQLAGIADVRFAVWAPNARRVSVVGDLNDWDGRRHPMRLRPQAGVWEVFILRLKLCSVYKYESLGPSGELLPLRADPVAWSAEAPPGTASIVVDTSPIDRNDATWRRKFAGLQTPDAPMAIYKVHAASWIPASLEGLSAWESLSERLAPYVHRVGFTHVELMPITEHPFGGAWAYEQLGQFAPSAKLGPPRKCGAMIERFHQAGIGVLLDSVPARFPTDAHGIARFSRTALYERADPKEGFHRDWNTLNYNLGQNEVRGFLIGSALYWREHYHADGLRVDAVASMLYRDYSRNAGEWVPNRDGGREKLEATEFLQELSRFVAQRCAGAVLIAKERTALRGVTRSPAQGGLEFHYKWNMGWMHDTLHYMQEDSVNRRGHHDKLTFGLVCAFSERFTLSLSHDEVVRGKNSLLPKTPGDRWKRIANLPAYLAFMWSHPGKKLLFMFGEFAQVREWDHHHGPDWYLLDEPEQTTVQLTLRDLKHSYCNIPALHKKDCRPDGLAWVILADRAQSISAYLRFGDPADSPVLAIGNFTPVPRRAYRVGVPRRAEWREIFNNDAMVYGGSNLGNGGVSIADDVPSHDQPLPVAGASAACNHLLGKRGDHSRA